MTPAKQNVRGWQAVAVTTAASLVAAFAPIASAQDAGLIAKLKADLVCAEPDAASQLLRNADAIASDLADLLMALDEISIDATACVQIREAASALALELGDANPGLDPVAVEASAKRMQQALVQADRHASSLRFEVGPPPRNLTRNRATQQ